MGTDSANESVIAIVVVLSIAARCACCMDRCWQRTGSGSSIASSVKSKARMAGGEAKAGEGRNVSRDDLRRIALCAGGGRGPRLSCRRRRGRSATAWRSTGLMRADLDGVLVNDLSLASVEGLARLQRAGFARGRAEPLPVFGPEGLLDGRRWRQPAAGGIGWRRRAASGRSGRRGSGSGGQDRVRLRRRNDPRLRGQQRRTASTGSTMRQKSLIIAGCTARPRMSWRRTRGTCRSCNHRRIVRKAARHRRSGGGSRGSPLIPASMHVARGGGASRLAMRGWPAGLLAPLIPHRERVCDWAEAATFAPDLKLAVGSVGTALDLTGETLRADSALIRRIVTRFRALKSRRGPDPSQDPVLPGRPRCHPRATIGLVGRHVRNCGELEASSRTLSTGIGAASGRSPSACHPKTTSQSRAR